MIAKAITISNKGQIVVPKKFTEHLNSKVVKLEISDNQEVRIIPIKDVAGSLTEFVKKQTSTDLKDTAWEQSVEENFTKE